MSTIKTKDGTEIYYKDWGTGQPVVFLAFLGGEIRAERASSRPSTRSLVTGPEPRASS